MSVCYNYSLKKRPYFRLFFCLYPALFEYPANLIQAIGSLSCLSGFGIFSIELFLFMNISRSMRQTSPFFLKRVKYFLSRLFGTRLQKAKGIHFVTVNGQQYKRLILCDSFLANEIEQQLEVFGESGYFPPLVARYEHEIWLEYVDGSPIRLVDEGVVLKIAEFYATVYGKNPVLVNAIDSPFIARLSEDLRFLYQIGVVTQGVYQDLQAAVPDLTPEQLWVGHEYTDPVLKNFIQRTDDGRICIVDVDGLAVNQLLGTGVAKACVRWLGPHQSLFFTTLVKHGAPDIQAYFNFVQLYFLAKWMKRAFLEQDWKVIDSTLFERFRHPH